MTLHFDPPIIAHRGASAYAPENTIAAFTKAMQLGVKWVEFDVMQAACGKAVVFHDDRLERTTNGQGQLANYPYDYLEKLDAGAWFNPMYASERIPTLNTTLAFLRNANLSANIEIKPAPGKEATLVDAILEEIAHLHYPREHILLSSFSIPALHCVRKLAPHALIALLVDEWLPNWQSLCTTLHCASLNVNHELLTRERVSDIKAEQLTLLCYTVNDPARAKELLSWGVDAVFTDVPDKILTIL